MHPFFSLLRIMPLLAVLSVQAQEPVLDVMGASDSLAANVRSHVRLPELDCDASIQRLNRNLAGVRESVVRAGRALGYYQLLHDIQFQTREECWALSIRLEPGEPVRVGNVAVNVQAQPELFASVVANSPLREGDQLNQALYERIKTNLSATAVEYGYFDARFETSELRLDLVNNRADIALDFNPGQRYRFGEVEIEQPDALSPGFIRRFIAIEPGDYYLSETLLGARNSLNASNYFNSVSVSPALQSASEGRVPVSVRLAMRPRHVYSSGVGVTTDIGPRVRFDYQDRYSNERGHSVLGNLGLSPVQQNLDIGYRLPLANPATESLEISGGFFVQDTESFTSETTKLAATYSFINAHAWRQNYFVNLQHDDFTVADDTQVADLLIAGTSLNRTRADDALYPTRGWRLFAELKGASDAVLSSQSFLQLNLNGKLIEPVGRGRVLMRFDAGTSLVDDVGELPASIQYFSGGDQSVRGYKYQSLGPLDENGQVSGGKHKLSLGIEYDFQVASAWKLAAFVDAGNSFNRLSDLKLNRGVGLGVRWLSPIGPIRVDLASPLDNDNSLRLHITMGPDL